MTNLKPTKQFAKAKLILCGGGSGKQNYYANQKLNEIINHHKPLLYIPLAMDEITHPYDSCYEWIKKELSQVDLVGIDMVRSFEELAKKQFDSYAALFIGGGNTYKLLKGIKDNGIFPKIESYLSEGGIILGSSAGATIFGYDINVLSSMDPNDVKLSDTSGFNVLDGVSIFPHYTNNKLELSIDENRNRHRKFTNAIIDYSRAIGDVIAIPEEDAIFIDNGKTEILGIRPYFYFKEGQSQKIQPTKMNYHKPL